MDDIPCSLRWKMSAVETEQERDVMAARNISFVVRHGEREVFAHCSSTCLHLLIHQLFRSDAFLYFLLLPDGEERLRCTNNSASVVSDVPLPDIVNTCSQTEILTHTDLSNGPNSTESFPHYMGILNPKEEVEGAR